MGRPHKKLTMVPHKTGGCNIKKVQYKGAYSKVMMKLRSLVSLDMHDSMICFQVICKSFWVLVRHTLL